MVVKLTVTTMRKSSSGRQSLAPLRVKNDGAVNKPTSRPSSVGSRSSLGSTFGSGRLSVGRKSTAIPKYGNSTSVNLFGNRQRRSSGYGRTYGNEILKDPRPVSDRKFKEESIVMLVQFLSQQGYTHPISPKILHTPQTKDFLRIFEFLYKYLDPKYQVGQKHEEEIPKIVKSLCYPFNISKSNMFSIGSPHTWPHLLAALRWLMECVQYALSAEPDSVLFPARDDEFDSIPESQIAFGFVEQAYSEFLEGAEEHEALEEALKQQIRHKTVGMSGGLDHLASENVRLRKELEDLQSEPDRLADLKQRYQVILHDDQKFENYLNELDCHKRLQEQRYTEAENEHSALALELQALQEKNKEMRHIFDTQEFSPADVERLNMNRRQLHQQIESFEKENETLDRQIWDGEMLIGKSQEQIEAKCQSYNAMAQMLKLIPSTAENAHGRDYEMRLNVSNCGIDAVDFNSSIKPALMQMKKNCNEKVHETEARKINELEALDQVNEMIRDKEEEQFSLESKLKRMEEDLECKKQTTQREYAKLQQDIEMVQQETSDLRKSSEMSVQDAAELLQQTKKKREQQLKTMENEEKQCIDFITSVLTTIMDHKQIMQEQVTKAAECVENELKECTDSFQQMDL